ncbi:MAG: hypothetical protein EZS28_050438, partial [Streblomastix strix]
MTSESSATEHTIGQQNEVDACILLPHPDIFCNECQKQVVGIRYKCNACEDFDLCSKCMKIQPPVHNAT